MTDSNNDSNNEMSQQNKKSDEKNKIEDLRIRNKALKESTAKETNDMRLIPKHCCSIQQKRTTQQILWLRKKFR